MAIIDIILLSKKKINMWVRYNKFIKKIIDNVFLKAKFVKEARILLVTLAKFSKKELFQ